MRLGGRVFAINLLRIYLLKPETKFGLICTACARSATLEFPQLRGPLEWLNASIVRFMFRDAPGQRNCQMAHNGLQSSWVWPAPTMAKLHRFGDPFIFPVNFLSKLHSDIGLLTKPAHQLPPALGNYARDETTSYGHYCTLKQIMVYNF